MRGFSVLKDKENPINKMVHSRLNDFSSTVSHSGFSLKYVVEGTENYEIENREFVVNAGEYLLVNHNLLTAIAGQGQLNQFNNEAFYSKLALTVAQQKI